MTHKVNNPIHTLMREAGWTLVEHYTGTDEELVSYMHDINANDGCEYCAALEPGLFGGQIWTIYRRELPKDEH